jgi:hypothetical protein
MDACAIVRLGEVCTQSVDTGFLALGYAKVSVLGVVQGITELLPISSTAHIRALPALLGWQDPGSAFSAAMELAALAAVVSYFWIDLRDLTVNSWLAVLRRKLDDRPAQRDRLGLPRHGARAGVRGALDRNEVSLRLARSDAHWELQPPEGG